MKTKIKKEAKRLSRRKFLERAATVSAFSIIPAHVFGGPGRMAPSDKLNIAGVGIGGMGNVNLENMATENIVALCDVDWNYAGKVFEKYPKAKRYKDFRLMLEKEKNIDAVIIATPDHAHAVVSMAAMELGKDVYTQKPLTHLVSEARSLAGIAQKKQLVTQMGNQDHSRERIRLMTEWLRDGAIGPVHEVHTWTDRPVWPQNIYTRPKGMPVTEGLDWDLWLGPAPARQYNKIYLPFTWRGWWDFGTGALGDMGCHIIDLPYTALNLKYPDSVNASYAMPIDPNDIWQKKENNETYPLASMVTYNFPARGEMPPVKLVWYDGGLMPSRPEELEQSRKMLKNGILLVGEKGKIISGGDMIRLIPETAMQAYKRPPKTLSRITVTHEQNWIKCCKDRKTSSSHFGYAGPLTETVLLGNVALRFPYEKLEFDAEKIEIKNNPAATEYLQTHYREGWSW
ncbi:MAG TPA: Gfo/Idh/MocA family oxidoreductase [Bacteroidetes bacterium]|nr:Gfo/Idh/MocA family oxidoreductase [Bacteroidota bacterium]